MILCSNISNPSCNLEIMAADMDTHFIADETHEMQAV